MKKQRHVDVNIKNAKERKGEVGNQPVTYGPIWNCPVRGYWG